MKIFAITSVLMMFFSTIASAHQGIVHYEGQTVETTTQAVKVLKEKVALIDVIVKSKKLSDQDLEKIHEISYSLETASDKLMEKYDNNVVIDSIAEAVQALHASSENHKEAETRKWFKQLSGSVENLELPSLVKSFIK